MAAQRLAAAPWAHRALIAGGAFACELHETHLEEAAAIARGAGFADARIVRELLSDTSVIRFDGERLTTIPALAPVPEKYVTESDVNALQSGERPQLAGELIHRQIDAANYPLLLDMWRRAADPKRSARQRHEAYGMFRTGLDLLDLDPVMYRMLDMNPAGMGHWLPALVKANEGKTFFRIPKTTIAKAPLTLLQLSRVEYESLTAATLDVVDRWAQAAFRLKPDESYFLKTGTFSSKYDYRNAHVTGPHEVAQIGEYLLYIQSQAVGMAGPLNEPAMYGVSTTNEMVVREHIPDRLGLPTIYMGSPLRCEYRCFIDCDTDEPLGIHPYWDPKVMNHRFRDWPDSDTRTCGTTRSPTSCENRRSCANTRPRRTWSPRTWPDCCPVSTWRANGRWTSCATATTTGSSTWRPPNAPPITNRRCRKGSVGR